MARVLVIDDDDDTRRMLCEVLTRAGHEAADAGAAGLGIQRSEGSLRELPVNRFGRAELLPTLIWVSKRSRRTASRSGGSYFFALIENAGTFRESGDFR